jgi:hypothetical protein
MAPLALTRSRIEQFVRAVGDRLDGEWLLVGGGAAALWFLPTRVTEDIDLFGLGATNRERADLLDLAASEAMPLEIVNTTADYFVRRIEGWRDQLEVLHRGARSTIYRPNATLFLLLKAARLTETDLQDCVALLAFAPSEIDRARVRRAMEALPPSSDEALAARRQHLVNLLKAES